MTLLRRLPLLLVCLALAGCATVDYGPEPPPAEIVREPRTPPAKPAPAPRTTPEYLPRPPPRVAVAIPLITNLTFRDVAAVRSRNGASRRVHRQHDVHRRRHVVPEAADEHVHDEIRRSNGPIIPFAPADAAWL